MRLEGASGMPIDTKAVIVNAFEGLTRQQNVDKISVTDVVNACGLSRQSFYYHFRDIFEVIEWVAKQKTRETLARSLAADTLEMAFQELIHAVADNYSFLHKLIISSKWKNAERIFFTGNTCLFAGTGPAQVAV